MLGRIRRKDRKAGSVCVCVCVCVCVYDDDEVKK